MMGANDRFAFDPEIVPVVPCIDPVSTLKGVLNSSMSRYTYSFSDMFTRVTDLTMNLPVKLGYVDGATTDAYVLPCVSPTIVANSDELGVSVNGEEDEKI